MKYVININQRAAVEMGLEVDFVDLAILDFTAAYLHSSLCDRVVVGDRSYGRLDPLAIIREMPLLGIASARGINIRIEKLVSAGLLVRCPDNKALHNTYLCMGKRYEEYAGLVAVQAKPEPVEKPVPAVKDTRTPSQKRSANLTLPHGERFATAWNSLLREPKWRDKSVQALNMSLNKLRAVTEISAIAAINETIERGYQGVFPKDDPAQPFRPAHRATTVEDLMK